MAVNAEALQKIMKMVPNDSRLSIKYRDNPNKEEIEFEFNCGYDAIARLSLMDLDVEKLGIPPTEYGVTIDAERTAFHKLFANLSTNGDTAKFRVVDGDLLISAEGEGGSFDARLTGNPNSTVYVNIKSPIRPLEFSLKYLNKMTGATFCDRVMFDINSETPGRITYAIEGEEGPTGALRFYLAPREEEE